MTESVRDALARVRDRLAEAGCDSPEVDAELLLAHVLGTTRSGVVAGGDRTLTGHALSLIHISEPTRH